MPPVASASGDMKTGINFSDIRRKSILKSNQKSKGNFLGIKDTSITIQGDPEEVSRLHDSENHLKRLADTMKNRKSYMISHQVQVPQAGTG